MEVTYNNKKLDISFDIFNDSFKVNKDNVYNIIVTLCDNFSIYKCRHSLNDIQYTDALTNSFKNNGNYIKLLHSLISDEKYEVLFNENNDYIIIFNIDLCGISIQHKYVCSLLNESLNDTQNNISILQRKIKKQEYEINTLQETLNDYDTKINTLIIQMNIINMFSIVNTKYISNMAIYENINIEHNARPLHIFMEITTIDKRFYFDEYEILDRIIKRKMEFFAGKPVDNAFMKPNVELGNELLKAYANTPNKNIEGGNTKRTFMYAGKVVDIPEIYNHIDAITKQFEDINIYGIFKKNYTLLY